MFQKEKKYSQKPESKATSDRRLSAPLDWPRRLLGNILILCLIFSGLTIIVTLRENIINKQIEAWLQKFYETTAHFGLGLDDMIVQGRDKTTLDEINNVLNLKRGDSLLGLKMRDIQEKLQNLPWVESVQLRRTYFPNTLEIKLHEKNVIALWQVHDKFYPIDEKGQIIEAEYVPQGEVLVIVGDSAPEKIVELLQITTQTPEIQKRMKAAVLFGGRRWDIILDNLKSGLTIKLPHENMERAWKKLVKIDQQYGILKRKLTIIDLRFKNRLNVSVEGSATKPAIQAKKEVKK